MARMRVGETLHSDTGTPYLVSGPLGEGGFGEAYVGHRLSSRGRRVQPVAIKVCQSLEDWHGEAYFGRLLKGDPRVVELLDAFVTATGRGQRQRRRHVLVFEYMEQGTVWDAIESAGLRWSEGKVRAEIRALLKLLRRMHSVWIIHRDIEPDNVYLRDGRLVLGDFGITKLGAGPEGLGRLEVPAGLRPARPGVERDVGPGRGHLPGRPARGDPAVRRRLVERPRPSAAGHPTGSSKPTSRASSMPRSSYVSGGMTWQSDYNVVVQDDPGKKTDLLDMIGWITMQNHSGKTFENARIKLLAGDVSKVQANTMSGRVYAAEAKAMDMAAPMAPPVQEKSFDEFHLYTLQRPTTLRDEETKQVEFVGATGIHAKRLFIYDGAQTGQYGYYNFEQIRNDPNYGTASNPKVWVMEEFKNADTNHLGIALPKGKLRFYRRDTDGHLEFVGENMIDHTPKDETIRVYTGNAFDVVGERKRTNYRVDSNQHWMDETFEIRLRNHKKEAVDVRAVEHLYRWTNWRITDESSEHQKKDAQTIEFPVTIAPNGERVITYTVHYSW